MSFFDDLGSAVGGAFCVWLGGVDNAESWLQRSVGFPAGGVGAGIRGALCDDPTPPPVSPPPFNGGQCPGVSYTVFRTRVSTSTGQPIENDVGDYPGPVTISSPTNVLNQQGDPLPNLWQYTINEGRPSEQPFQTASDGPPTFRTERADGLPDDCGDPDPIIPEFEPPNLPITVPDPDGGPDIDLDLTINAPIIIGPNVFAPVSITGPDINFNGTIELNPDFNISIGSGIGGGGGGGFGTGVESDQEDYDPESPDNPPNADGRRIIGLIVTLSLSNDVRATELAQDGDIGSIGVPRVAIAYLISNNGGVRVALSGVDLKLRNTYIPVPPTVEVVSWRIHTEPGVSVANVRPVYGTTRPVE